MVELTVARLRLDNATGAHVVILREKDGRRILPIWIGQPEAVSIVEQLNHIKRERPLTHDLCKALITGLGGTLRRVTITRVHNSTYFAELQIDGPTGVVEFDARPSDSIAIALRFDAPIYAPETLLTDVESEGDEAADVPSMPPEGELTPEQLKAYLERLRPEDFGKFTP